MAESRIGYENRFEEKYENQVMKKFRLPSKRIGDENHFVEKYENQIMRKFRIKKSNKHIRKDWGLSVSSPNGSSSFNELIKKLKTKSFFFGRSPY